MVKHFKWQAYRGRQKGCRRPMEETKIKMQTEEQCQEKSELRLYDAKWSGETVSRQLGRLMEMTLGFYCSPKREVLSPKSFIVEVVLKLWGQLPDFFCGFMSFAGLNVSSGGCGDTHRCRCVSCQLTYVAKWSEVRLPVCLSAVSKISRSYIQHFL